LEESGLEHMRLGELGEAERDLTAAVQQRENQNPGNQDHPSLTPGLNNLAVLHLKQHRLEEAAAGFRRVVQILEDQQQIQLSSRTALEIDIAKKNLATAERLMAKDAPPLSASAAASSSSSGSSGSSFPSSAWDKVRGLRGDSLKSAARKNKERIASLLGIDVTAMSEAEIDGEIKRSIRGDVVDTETRSEVLRGSIDLAFSLLDANGDGTLSKMEVLQGLERQEVQEMLQMGPFTDKDFFDRVYASIDTDGSNSIDRPEFVSHFLRKLSPADRAESRAYESAAEKKARLAASAATKFMSAGQAHRDARESARAVPIAHPPTLHSHPHYRPGSATALNKPELADIAMYEDVTRGLETSNRRRVGLEQDILALQSELRAVEADIVAKSSSADRLRAALTSHSSSHSSIVRQMNERLRHIDHAKRLADRPELRTSDRIYR